jgi:branched-chain amino acid transport system permease protein
VLATLVVATAIAAFMMRRISNSPFGRIIEAIRDNEEAVKALGKDPARFKIQVLMVGAGLAGIAGAFYAHYITYIVPDQFIPLVTFYVWMAIIMGGVGRVSGAVVGTAILMLFLEGSRFLRDIVPGVSEVEMASVRIGAVGLALVLFTIYRPQGLMGDYTKR